MWYKKYTTLQWIWFLGGMTIMFSLLTQEVTNTWTFLIVVATFLLLLASILLNRWNVWKRKRDINKIDVNFYLKETSPALFKVLTIGIGTHTICLMVTTQVEVFLNAPVLTFKPDERKPVNDGNDYGEMFVVLDSGQIRDRFGTVSTPSEYPRLLSPNQFWPICIRVRADYFWAGKLWVQIPVSGENTTIQRYLEFKVTDEIGRPLTISANEQKPIFETHQAAGTTQI